MEVFAQPPKEVAQPQPLASQTPLVAYGHSGIAAALFQSDFYSATRIPGWGLGVPSLDRGAVTFPLTEPQGLCINPFSFYRITTCTAWQRSLLYLTTAWPMMPGMGSNKYGAHEARA